MAGNMRIVWLPGPLKPTEGGRIISKNAVPTQVSRNVKLKSGMRLYPQNHWKYGRNHGNINPNMKCGCLRKITGIYIGWGSRKNVNQNAESGHLAKITGIAEMSIKLQNAVAYGESPEFTFVGIAETSLRSGMRLLPQKSAEMSWCASDFQN